LTREGTVAAQEKVDDEDDPKVEDEPKDAEVREMKSSTREDTVAAQKKVNEGDDTSAEKNPPKEAEVLEKPLTREEEFSAELAYVKEEMSSSANLCQKRSVTNDFKRPSKSIGK